MSLCRVNPNEILKTKDILMRSIANASSNAHGVNETVSLSDIYTFIKEVLLFLAGDLPEDALRQSGF